MTDGDRHEFRTTASRIEYEGAILALRVDDVVMPGDATAVREVVEHFGAVAIVAIDEHDQIVMVDQYRHPVGDRLWELPAGLLDEPGESPVAAAQRELMEETGLSARTWAVLVDAAVSPGMTDEAIRVFVAQDLQDIDRPDPEHEEADMHIHRIPLADAVRKVLNGDIVNATAIAGILALDVARRNDVALRSVDAPWSTRPTKLAQRRHPSGE
ncbi:NUDIX hydrolase [Hoyosella rhizosphaerae]|uniref:ADP-ribose pyrophosphatase n=1 Tax=Hoyosella rhizosphaerae TaxID=1755582 RepID=A0A916U7I2_9ACTN|nr:NUDIX hydrolase [Hoyosella rhizosphaerae]MBN4926188.1 NUDIX hydrolase [Hoyosella rhizosphaerae]GGC61425.1 ADP-ribose pyrophosphatase [Hoyosella rhizosphaerae]